MARMQVVSVEKAPASELMVYVRVVNQSAKPMRLQRLEYTFAAASIAPGQGQLELQRDVAPGGAAVFGVPIQLTGPAPDDLVLSGRMFAELDKISQSFPMSAHLGVATP
jgi:hypothetical protein